KLRRGQGQPPQPRLFRGFPDSPSAAKGSGMTLVARQRSQGAPHLPKLPADRDQRPPVRSHRGGQRPNSRSIEWDGGGSRNARATSAPSRFWNVPRQFTLENRRAAASSAANIRQLQETRTFWMNPLLTRLSRLATAKHLPLVQKLWTLLLPCGKSRKTKKE